MNDNIRRKILMYYKRCLVESFNEYMYNKNFLYGYLYALRDSGLIGFSTLYKFIDFFSVRLEKYRGYRND